MQKDKGLLMADGVTWAKKMAILLQPLCHHLIISINPGQHAYQAQLAGYTLITDDASLDIHGPLLGLFSVHQHFPEEDIFLLACDMQQMKTEVLDLLAGNYHANPGFEAWVFLQPDGSPEPLAALYSAKALSKMMAKHRQAAFPKHSMKFLLEQLRVFSLPIPPEMTFCFANFNTPSEVAFACRS